MKSTVLTGCIQVIPSMSDYRRRTGDLAAQDAFQQLRQQSEQTACVRVFCPDWQAGLASLRFGAPIELSSQCVVWRILSNVASVGLHCYTKLRRHALKALDCISSHCCVKMQPCWRCHVGHARSHVDAAWPNHFAIAAKAGARAFTLEPKRFLCFPHW